MYKVIRSLLFLLPAESAHKFTLQLFRILHYIPGFGWLLRNIQVKGNQKPVLIAGLQFPNRVGLAAGFDKDAKHIREFQNLGFGSIEIGTVTPKAQKGNPKPRLFRLKEDEAIINRMGFNNEGVEAMVSRLKRLKKTDVIIGGNIGKNKNTPNEDAASDYIHCLKALKPYVDYFTVNISSPNTPGLRELQKKESLSKLLAAIQEENASMEPHRPIFLKISPDESFDQIDDILEVIQEHRLDGIIATNTTITRDGLRTSDQIIQEIGNGGLSGAPLLDRSTRIVQYISTKTQGKLPIIAVGGINNSESAMAKFNAGASLVQIYSGFIYEGPSLVKKIAAL